MRRHHIKPKQTLFLAPGVPELSHEASEPLQNPLGYRALRSSLSGTILIFRHRRGGGSKFQNRRHGDVRSHGSPRGLLKTTTLHQEGARPRQQARETKKSPALGLEMWKSSLSATAVDRMNVTSRCVFCADSS